MIHVADDDHDLYEFPKASGGKLNPAYIHSDSGAQDLDAKSTVSSQANNQRVNPVQYSTLGHPVPTPRKSGRTSAGSDAKSSGSAATAATTVTAADTKDDDQSTNTDKDLYL